MASISARPHGGRHCAQVGLDVVEHWPLRNMPTGQLLLEVQGTQGGEIGMPLLSHAVMLLLLLLYWPSGHLQGKQSAVSMSVEPLHGLET